MLNAFQSVIILMVMTRVLGLKDAGIYTIANATANLMLFIGRYQMRNYQVTDRKNKYTFREYRMSRAVTCTAMIAASAAYTVYALLALNYTAEKALIVMLACVYRMVDAAEDVYTGLYQKNGRLDLSGKIVTWRYVITISLFIAVMLLTKSQIKAFILSTLVTMVYFAVTTKVFFPRFADAKETYSRHNVTRLLGDCFALFAGGFLSFYLGNAPKYAIDALLGEESQAIYGFLSMPVFVTGLLSNFVYQPILVQLTDLWSIRDLKNFGKQVRKQIIIILLITAVTMLGAWVCGIPVLGKLYGTDLSGYLPELEILLAGGGLLGITGFLLTLVTILRCQKDSLWIYSAAAVCALLFANPFVRMYGIMGASVFYLIIVVGVTVALAGDYTYRLLIIQREENYTM